MISLETQDRTISLSNSCSAGPIMSRGRTAADPMANVANLVDVMLVLACGLMLAIVTFWQIELPDVTQVLKQREMTEISDVQDITDKASESGAGYNELGTVYEDPSTGQMYLIQGDGSATETS